MTNENLQPVADLMRDIDMCGLVTRKGAAARIARPPPQFALSDPRRDRSTGQAAPIRAGAGFASLGIHDPKSVTPL